MTLGKSWVLPVSPFGVWIRTAAGLWVVANTGICIHSSSIITLSIPIIFAESLKLNLEGLCSVILPHLVQ